MTRKAARHHGRPFFHLDGGEITNFLQQFFSGTQHGIELRTVPMVAREFSRDPVALDLFISKHKSTNIFFGCCTRDGNAGTKADCRELVAFWVDIDFKDVTEEESRKELDCFPLKPSIIISSGGGYHVYWLLKEPHEANDPRCEAILRGVAAVVHGDRQATDFSRILRVPGTLNHKYKPAREVKIVSSDWDCRYNFNDFEMYEEVGPAVTQLREGKIVRGSRTSALVALAGFMNRKGNTVEEAEAAAIGMNTRFDPPMGEKDVLRKVRDVFKRYEKQHSNGHAISSEIECVLADSIEPEPLVWLWENRIPSGKLTVFCGVPDTGKSTVAIDIASRCTNGTAWPDCANTRNSCDVLMLVSEDDLKDTVVPRLIAAGAKLEKIHFAMQTVTTFKEKREERRIALDSDLRALEEVLVRAPEIKLVIVDPLGSYLGKLKKNAEEDIRLVLTELKELAERAGIAFISIDHFNKKSDQAGIHRLSGAGALAAVPRAVWAFVKDTEDVTHVTRLMLNAKLNVVSEAKKSGLKYWAVGSEIEIRGIPSSLPIIQWGSASTTELDDVLQKQVDPERNKASKCGAWLKELLEKGSQMSREVYAAAEALGYSERTVKRMVRELGVTPVKTRMGWKMELHSNENSTEEM